LAPVELPGFPPLSRFLFFFSVLLDVDGGPLRKSHSPAAFLLVKKFLGAFDPPFLYIPCCQFPFFFFTAHLDVSFKEVFPAFFITLGLFFFFYCCWLMAMEGALSLSGLVLGSCSRIFSPPPLLFFFSLFWSFIPESPGNYYGPVFTGETE